jgi:hypothetical protein
VKKPLLPHKTKKWVNQPQTMCRGFYRPSRTYVLRNIWVVKFDCRWLFIRKADETRNQQSSGQLYANHERNARLEHKEQRVHVLEFGGGGVDGFCSRQAGFLWIGVSGVGDWGGWMKKERKYGRVAGIELGTKFVFYQLD